ncbi:DUF4374 domain-containing protein [Polaribacter sargassicola]|uniref:DUF4374 domain-containing protein n=1 Tax=Polaribacter sargassicola TaxID=2836891 RepID=UPI001F3870AA|nr:DUF4374 domain-containing protein [Polaribacter sp. DS7-9]MCG1035315.1 DUF4374 domain-containing protein [Polaribacter sp. DS7-9]
MKSKNQILSLLAVSALLFFTACSDDNSTEIDDIDDVDDTVEVSKYVIAASSGENDYLVYSDNIDAGTTLDATAADAIQSPGTRVWANFGEEVLYGFLYNGADASTSASYIMNEDGTISKRNELALDVSIHTRGVVNDDIILVTSDRLRDTTVAQQAYFYKVDSQTDASTEYTLVTDDLLEDGEIAYFTDVAEYEDQIILGARSINSSSFSSDYFNSTYVVVLNDDFTVNQVIKDSGRTGSVASQKYSQGDTGLEVVENGDLYVFSAAQTDYATAATSDVPSGILKINQGTYEFDEDYFFNITEASGGYNLFRSYYTGGTTFILAMYPGTGDNATFGIDADRFAVVDVATKSFTWVTGFPADALVGWEYRVPYLDSENGRLILTASPSETENYLYSIDPDTATATQLAEIIGESAKAVSKLTYKAE